MVKVNPALREKKRYVVFEVIGKNANCTDVIVATKDSFIKLFGALETAKAAISGIKSNGDKCMMRVNRRYVDKLKAAAILVKRIKNGTVILRSVGVSGSVKGATNKYFGV